MALSGMKGLQAWCRQVTNGYRDVTITNMTSSWRDGLAFCAIIHHYRPDLIDYDSLSKENIEHNNGLAFTVAESLSIPALLDVEDMVLMHVPDKLSIMTYVSQYYNYFRDKPPGGSLPKSTSKRPSTTPPAKSAVPSIKRTPPIKSPMGSKPVEIKKEHPCTACGKPVYLMERLTAEGKLYHRLCLKCCVCGIRLKTSNYRYKSKEKQFFCHRDYESSKNGELIDGPIENREKAETPNQLPNRDHRSTSEPSQAATTTNGARNRFFSENDAKSEISKNQDQNRSQAASYLSGLIASSTERNAKMQKQISAPAGYSSASEKNISQESNADNIVVTHQGYHKPSDFDSNLSSVQEINDSPMDEPSRVDKGNAAPAKPKKLVLKVKKKRPKASTTTEKNDMPSKGTSLPPQKLSKEEINTKVLDASQNRKTTTDKHSSESPTKKPNGTHHIGKATQLHHGEISDTSIGNISITTTPETGIKEQPKSREKLSPATRIINDAGPTGTATLLPKKTVSNANKHTNVLTPTPKPRQTLRESDVDTGKQIPARVAPQRPPPAAEPATAKVKRKAPERPSYIPSGDISPRFVGPRAPRFSQPEAKVEKRIALRDKQLSLQDISAELRLNDARQAELEQRGVRMEKKLRSQAKGDPAEEYLIEWFDLVNEKNKLLRRENELIYMAQELEFLKKQQDIECELRNLIEKNEHSKTNKDRKREEQLLNQLLQFVSKRDQIVGKLEEDRIKEIEEDKVIAIVMEEQGLTRKSKKPSRFFF